MWYYWLGFLCLRWTTLVPLPKIRLGFYLYSLKFSGLQMYLKHTDFGV